MRKSSGGCSSNRPSVKPPALRAPRLPPRRHRLPPLPAGLASRAPGTYTGACPRTDCCSRGFCGCCRGLGLRCCGARGGRRSSGPARCRSACGATGQRCGRVGTRRGCLARCARRPGRGVAGRPGGRGCAAGDCSGGGALRLQAPAPRPAGLMPCFRTASECATQTPHLAPPVVACLPPCRLID